MISKSQDWDLKRLPKLVQKWPNDNEGGNLFFNILTRFRLLYLTCGSGSIFRNAPARDQFCELMTFSQKFYLASCVLKLAPYLHCSNCLLPSCSVQCEKRLHATNLNLPNDVGERERRLSNNVQMQTGKNVWSQVMLLPYLETLYCRRYSRNTLGRYSLDVIRAFRRRHDLIEMPASYFSFLESFSFCTVTRNCYLR